MKILGLSSRKGGGKNTAANFILGIYLIHYGVIKGQFEITPEGLLSVSDIFGDESHAGIINQDYYSTHSTYEFWRDNIWSHIKIYSFADLLKRNICMDILGLTNEQCFGTNDQKNSPTKYKWEDMPKFRTGKRTPVKTETLSAREVMQFIGTDIFRKISNNVWVDALMNQIEIEQPRLAVVCDCRFPNEVEGIKRVGGKVIRLLRSPHKEDEHESEKALDNKNFHWSKFDNVLKNQSMSIPQQNEAIYKILRSWDYIPELEE